MNGLTVLVVLWVASSGLLSGGTTRLDMALLLLCASLELVWPLFPLKRFIA